jgi:hypothetical protein
MCSWPDGWCPKVEIKKNLSPPEVYADNCGPLNGWDLIRIQT